MKEEVLGVILLHVLMLSTRTTATDEYNISDSQTTWTAASNSGKLATPRFSYDSIFLEVSDKIPGEMRTLWVGYVTLYHKFEYIGCVANSTLNVTSRIIKVVAYPGRCFAACGGGKFFGLLSSNCYCFNSTQPILDNRDECYHIGCEGEAFARCGGWDARRDGVGPVVALYQEVGMSTSEDGMVILAGRYCRSYDPRTSGFQWESCQTWYSPLCNDTGATALNTFTKYWNTAVSECFKQDMYPLYNITTPPNVTGQTFSGQRLWTAMFRSPVIHTALGDQYAGTPGIKYGYIYRHEDSDKNSSKYVLDFMDSKSEERHSLCVIERTTERTTTPTSSSTSSMTSTPIAAPSDEQDDEKLLGLYIGVAIGCVLVVVIAVGATIIILRRRTKQPRKVNKTEEPHNHTTDASTAKRDQESADDYITACSGEDPSVNYEYVTNEDISTAGNNEPSKINTAASRIGTETDVQNNYEDVSNDSYINTDVQNRPAQKNAVKPATVGDSYVNISGTGPAARDAPATTQQQAESRPDDDNGGYYTHNIYQGLTGDNMADTSHVYLKMNEFPNAKRDTHVTQKQEGESRPDDDSGGYYTHNIYQGLTEDNMADTSHLYLKMNEVPNKARDAPVFTQQQDDGKQRRV